MRLVSFGVTRVKIEAAMIGRASLIFDSPKN